MSDRFVLAPKVHHVFRLLALVGRHGGVNRAMLCEETGLSRASLSRLIRTIRQLYGVRLVWDPRAEEYAISDWGVFDGAQLLRHVRRLAKSGDL